MHLTGKKRHIVYYCLMNTPDWLIDRAVQRAAWDLGYEEPTEKLYNEIKASMTYDHVDPKLRIKSFEFDYDENAILGLINRVKECREYIQELCQSVENDK